MGWARAQDNFGDESICGTQNRRGYKALQSGYVVCGGAPTNRALLRKRLSYATAPQLFIRPLNVTVFLETAVADIKGSQAMTNTIQKDSCPPLGGLQCLRKTRVASFLNITLSLLVFF